MSDKTQRVICTIEGASHLLDDVLFATVPMAEGACHVSERITAAKADRLCSIGGFEPFDGQVKERDIELALQALRDQLAAQSKPTADGATAEQVEALQGANMAMAGDLARLQDENQALQEKLRQADPAALATLQQRADSLATELGTAQAVAEQFRTAAEAKDGELAQLRDALAQQKATIDQLTADLTAKDAEIAKLREKGK